MKTDKTYKTRAGIVLISVCNEHMLVATREARAFCPYIQQINSAAAYYWKMLEGDMEMKDMVEQAAEYFNIPKIQALITLNNFVKKLADMGYLLSENTEDVQ